MAWYNLPITHGYIQNYDPAQWDTPHYAVDIGMPQDTPITAIKSGKVVQADYAIWGGKPGGGEVWIQPDDGSTEYYFYHLDQNDVTSGQHVKAGDVVGLSGGQNSGGSHPADPTWSSGPHLHVGYFTKWQSTPIGTRPYGPDITPAIKNLAIGGNVPDSSTATQNIAGFTIPSTRTIGVNVGVFIGAIVLIFAGAFFLFQKQIMGGIKHAI
jgi:murein DD-endopeptidase MepM/ murein hydrolase activator NlpD